MSVMFLSKGKEKRNDCLLLFNCKKTLVIKVLAAIVNDEYNIKVKEMKMHQKIFLLFLKYIFFSYLSFPLENNIS